MEKHHFWGSGSKLDMKNSPIFRNFGSFSIFGNKIKSMSNTCIQSDIIKYKNLIKR